MKSRIQIQDLTSHVTYRSRDFPDNTASIFTRRSFQTQYLVPAVVMDSRSPGSLQHQHADHQRGQLPDRHRRREERGTFTVWAQAEVLLHNQPLLRSRVTTGEQKAVQPRHLMEQK